MELSVLRDLRSLSQQIFTRCLLYAETPKMPTSLFPQTLASEDPRESPYFL